MPERSLGGRVWKNKLPEENNGLLVTESNSFQISWRKIDGKVQEIGRVRTDKDRISSPDDMRLSDSDYLDHRVLAESVFHSLKAEKPQSEAEHG